MLVKRRSAWRREGRGTSLGKTLHAAGTVTASLAAVVNHSVTWAMLWPVQPGRGRPGASQPVQGDVVKHLADGEHLAEVAGVVGPGPELLRDPGAQPGGRIGQ